MTARAESGLLAAYLRPERPKVIGLVALLVAAMLLPVAGPLLIGQFVDQALAGEPVSALVGIALAYLAIALLADSLQLIVTWLSVRLAWRVGNQVRADLTDHALSLDLAWHGEHSPGLLIERIDGDIEAITTFSSTAVLHLLGNAVLLVGVIVVSLAIDWRAGLLIAASTLVASLLMIRLRNTAVPAHDHEREVLSQLYGDLEERLGGLEDLRANAAGEYVVHRLQAHSARWWQAARKASLHSDGAYVAAGAAFSLGSVATLALGVLLYRSGQITLGSVLVLFRFSQMIREPLELIAEQMREFQKAVAGARRASRLLATSAVIIDGTDATLPTGPLSVDLNGVSFSYDDERTVLHPLDLHLPAGSVLGVVGRTGSGKTSLGRLLVRFWDPTEGHVRVGGVDLRSVALTDLHRRVGLVTQEVELLRASVRDNLTMLGTVAASDSDLMSSLEEVGLRDWLGSLSDGLDTVIEGDEALSAGEAQLLAFARLFLVDPGLIVLDEASSRLDPFTEQQIASATDRLLEGRTVVIIAHRLETLERADQILVLDHGRVVEHGSRSDLADDPDGRFAHLLRAASGALTHE